jgi:imidazole glycerol phosphate synthase glutamine amidotransferase subunit
VLGQALDQALGDRAGIRRYGDVRLPMDEAIAWCALDLGGRGLADVEPRPDPMSVTNAWLELWPHFVETLAREARCAIHLEVRKARSTHHLVEGGAKALARALRQAAELDPLSGRRFAEHQGDAAVIAVVDFGAGNTRSVLRALASVGADARLVRTPDSLTDADRLVLPGVGAAGSAMAALQRQDLVGPMQEWVAANRPFLGICLGAQLLLDASEEDDASGLGVIAGMSRRFPPLAAGGPMRVPHIGWNRVEIAGGGFDAYFVHAYWLDPADVGVVAGWTAVDGFRFPSLLRTGSVIGTQFHVEKSGAAGRALLAAWAGGLLDSETNEWRAQREMTAWS